MLNIIINYYVCDGIPIKFVRGNTNTHTDSVFLCGIFTKDPYDYLIILGVFTSTGVTGYKGIRVTFLHLNALQKVILIPLYPVTPVLVNTPIVHH